MMRLCVVAPASIIHTVRWVNAMVDRGHQVNLITMHKANRNKIDVRVRVHFLRIPAPLGYYLNYIQMKRLIRSIQPDLLHIHFASGYGTLARLGHFHPTILSVWGSDVYYFPDRNRRSERILRKNLAAADHITSTSNVMKERTEQFVQPSQPIDVVPFGIDTELFQPGREQASDEEDMIVLGTVKGLEPVYGIDIMLRAAAVLIDRLQHEGKPDIAGRIRLQIVGDGSIRKELQQLAEDLGIAGRTLFTGAVANTEVPAYIQICDIVCMLSHRESFGVSALEAQSCSVPVIASDVGGLPEVVCDGETGFVVKNSHMDEIVDRLHELVLSPRLRRQMGQHGRQFVQQHYAWEDNVSRMESIYHSVIADVEDHFRKQTEG